MLWTGSVSSIGRLTLAFECEIERISLILMDSFIVFVLKHNQSELYENRGAFKVLAFLS